MDSQTERQPPEWELAQEWIDSADALARTYPDHVASVVGEVRARRRWPARNSDLPDVELGEDEAALAELERIVRWNAVMMVADANHRSDGIGGHLSTYASSSTLFSVGWDYHFRGRGHHGGGDHVFFQGHASPGVYARAYAEGRLDAEQLRLFRRETAGGLPSYPHPRLMPDFWEYPTVSMGLGPVAAIEQARVDRYLHRRNLADTSDRHVWAFLGDGECDEPETLGLIRGAGRDLLANLTFVISCNLQRLDGPANGSGSTITELAALFDGAGWNVITLWWGPRWEELLAAEPRLGWHLAGIADGDLQRLVATGDAAAVRDELLGPYAALVDSWDDDSVAALASDAAGADRHLLHRAYTAARAADRPTVVLARTVKGHLLPHAGRNAAHQVKKLTPADLHRFADNLGLALSAEQRAQIDNGGHPLVDAGAHIKAALERRADAAGGYVPARQQPQPTRIDAALEGYDAGSDTPASTTAVLTRMLRTLAKNRHVVPIVADEGRTFGFDPLYSDVGVFSPRTVAYRAVDADMQLRYREDAAGQVIQAGISEASAMGAFQAVGCAHANSGVPLVPIYTFYSMFGFQRVGDLIWQAADARARGILVGATAGRTTLSGEGLQHQDGHSLLWAHNVPHLHAWDCAFAYELADVLTWQFGRWNENHEELAYVVAYNEAWAMPARPPHVRPEDVLSGGYRFDDPARDVQLTIMFSGPAHRAAFDAAEMLARNGVQAALVAVTSFKALWLDALDVQRRQLLDPTGDHVSRVRELVAGNGPVVAVTDWTAALPSTVAPFIGEDLIVLGTDGFGRSDDRASLREHFATTADHVAGAACTALRRRGTLPGAAERLAGELTERFRSEGSWRADR